MLDGDTVTATLKTEGDEDNKPVQANHVTVKPTIKQPEEKSQVSFG